MRSRLIALRMSSQAFTEGHQRKGRQDVRGADRNFSLTVEERDPRNAERQFHPRQQDCSAPHGKRRRPMISKMANAWVEPQIQFVRHLWRHIQQSRLRLGRLRRRRHHRRDKHAAAADAQRPARQAEHVAHTMAGKLRHAKAAAEGSVQSARHVERGANDDKQKP